MLSIVICQYETQEKLLMASGSNDCKVKLYCLEHSICYLIKELPPHKSCVRAVCFSKHKDSTSSLLVTSGGKLQITFYPIDEGTNGSINAAFLCRNLLCNKTEVNQQINVVCALTLEYNAGPSLKAHIVLAGDSDGVFHMIEVKEKTEQSKRVQNFQLFKGENQFDCVDTN
jgi:WD40 repeat protein